MSIHIPHSLTIGDKNTWDDWHLYPDTLPTISIPENRTQFMEIPGMSGVLDFSTVLTGYPLYSNREGSWSFLADTDYGPWPARLSELMYYIHGMNREVTFEDDPMWYYRGVLSIDSWEPGEGMPPKVTINYTLDPYKYYIHMTELTYSIESGQTVSDTLTDACDRMPVTPFIVVSDSTNGINLRFENQERMLWDGTAINRTLQNGTWQVPEIIFTNVYGRNKIRLTMSGDGNIKFRYRRGTL